VNGSAIRATEDAAPRSSVASAPRRTRKRAAVGCVAVAMGLLLAATAAYALQLRAGDIVISAEGGLAPKALPKHENTPIPLHSGFSPAAASDGEVSRK